MNQTSMARILLFVLPILLVGSLGAQDPRFVPGQVMARFVDGSAANDAAIQASRTSPPNLAALAPVAESLGSSLRLPLEVTQISSGYWLVFSVDVEALTDRSLRMLRGRAGVSAARALAHQAEDADRAPGSVRVTVNFAQGSPEFKAVSDARAGRATEPLAALLAALQGDLGLPLGGEAAEEEGQLILQVNLESLTLRLVEELSALPDVESAQPNYILRAFGPGGE